MSDIKLLDYSNDDVMYVFTLETSRLIRAEEVDSSGLGVAGYASQKKIGVLRLHIIGVAIYCKEQELLLSIPGVKVNLCSSAVHGKVRLVAPFIREFCLTVGERVLYSCYYWHSGARVWPDDGDIFSLVERITNSPEATAKTHRMWSARFVGQPIIDVDD